MDDRRATQKLRILHSCFRDDPIHGLLKNRALFLSGLTRKKRPHRFDLPKALRDVTINANTNTTVIQKSSARRFNRIRYKPIAKNSAMNISPGSLILAIACVPRVFARSIIFFILILACLFILVLILYPFAPFSENRDLAPQCKRFRSPPASWRGRWLHRRLSETHSST